jgi:glycosyltransferase involved in cell wall biosynthesis
MQSGGAERIAASLSNHWVESGMNVMLVPTYSGRGGCYYPLDQRVNLSFLADQVPYGNTKGIGKFLRLIGLLRMVKSYQPDVIVSFLTHVNITAVAVSKVCNVPVVVSERIYPEHTDIGIVAKTLRKVLYPYADKVVVQSQKSLNWFQTVCSKANCVIIHNHVEYPLKMVSPNIPLEHVNTNKNIILAVGRLEYQKGFDTLLDSFSNVHRKYNDWDLVIVGKGGHDDYLRNYAEKLNLGSRVHFLGRVGNIGDWYQRAEIFVMSSRYEGFPNALLEAMSYGNAVISFDCDTGPREIIENNENGLLVPLDEGVNGLTKALLKLMDQAELRAQFSSSAKQVRQKFSIGKIGKAWDELLNDIRQ